MLYPTFYTLAAPLHATATSANVSIRLNPDHAIFAGHFPGQPVVPGVCMLHILKEVLEGATGRRLQLARAGNVKFLAVLVPGAHEVLEVALKFEGSDDGLTVSEATISAGAERFIRLQQARYDFRTSAHAPAVAAPL